MVMIFLALATLAILIAVYLYGRWTFDFFAKRDIPFTPPISYLGNQGPTLRRKKNMSYIVRDIYNHFAGHKVCGHFEFRRPIFLIRDPAMIKLVTVKDAEYFIDHRTFVTEDIEPLLSKGLVSLQGQRWKDMRSTLSPAFTSSKMKAMFVLVNKCGEQMADYLEKKCKESPKGMESLELKEFFTRYTNDVIATSAFGIHVDSLADPNNEFYEMGKVASKVTTARLFVFFLYMLFPRLLKLLDISLFPKPVKTFFHSLIHDTLEVREREGIVRPDMIHLLMQARKGQLAHDGVTEEGGDRKGHKRTELDEVDITANALLFFVAGFDTTSTLLCFICHQLATNPDIQTRVQEEVDRVLLEFKGELTYDGLQQMKYLDMVISETLRLYPPAVMTDRKCVKPYLLKDEESGRTYKLNEGDGLWIPIYPIQMDAQYFPDPEKFDPERFNDENKHKIHPFTYQPFGLGPRNCIGMRFAQMETKIAIVCLLRRFNLEVVAKTMVPLELDAKSFAMTVKGGFWVGFKPRTSS